MKRKVLSLLICTGIFLSIFGAPVALAAEDGKHYIMYDEDMENGDLYEVLSSISVTSGKQGKLSLVSDPLNASNRVMRINGDGEQLKLTATAEPYAEGSELSISYKFMKTDDSGWDPMRLYGSGITNGCLIHYTQNGFLYRTHKPNGTENGQAQTITPPVAQRVYTKPNVWYRLEIQYKNIADPNLDNSCLLYTSDAADD